MTRKRQDAERTSVVYKSFSNENSVRDEFTWDAWFDADIHGPNAAQFFGQQGKHTTSGELAESLGVDAQMQGIDAALAARPGLDEAEVRSEIQALIDGEIDRLARE